MLYLLKSVCFDSTKASFSEKTSEKFEYLVKTLVEALFCFKAASYIKLLPVIWAVYKRWIVTSRVSRVAMCITKIFDFLFYTTLVNSF